MCGAQDRKRGGVRLNIAHVTATFPPYWGGTGNVAYHNARVLHERGHTVTVFTAAPADRGPMHFPFETHYLPALFRIGNAPLTPALMSRLRGFDIIHLHYPYIFGAEIACAASRLFHTPLVVTYHNDLIATGTRGRLFKVYGATSQPLVLRAADQIVATSLDYARHSLLARIGSLAHTAVEVPNGVDVEVFTPGPGPEAATLRTLGIPEGASYVLFVGAMDHAHFFKGVPVLLEAMASIPGQHVICVGDGDLRAQFEATAGQRLPGRAHFVRSVELSRLVEFYQGAAVTVLPSTTQGEAFGMVLLESLACGRPVIATNLPGVRSVVTQGEDGFLIAPDDAGDLAIALRRVFGSSEDAKAMGTFGRRKAETDYGWKRVVDRLESVYETVHRGARTPNGANTASGNLR